MDTRFLESLVAVIDSGSIAEAARRLSLTPAGVAQRIHALEAEIASRLVVRSGRTMKLTEGGVAIIDHVRELLKQARDLRVMAANERPIGEPLIISSGLEDSWAIICVKPVFGRVRDMSLMR